MLTPEQKAHYDTFGFIVMRQHFSPDEMEEIIGEFERVLEEDRQGKPFDGQKRQAVLGFMEKSERLTQLIKDDRIYVPLEQMLGPGFVWIGSDGNIYVGDTHWHPDGSNLDYIRIKVAFYLDVVKKDSGCLRVIPGSHRPPLHEALKPLLETRNTWKLQGQSGEEPKPFAVTEREIPAFPLESEPGDVVFFNQNLWHASFGGSNRRRMFTLNVGQKPTKAEHLEFLQRIYQSNLKHAENMQYTQTKRVYEDAFLYSDHPRIRSMVAPLLEMGFK